ncbi:MAG: hypothetical protein JXK07_01465 [Spirochaetes bacterium]|nr:hypothetical protein [Spirochaetota bacterium]MBN2769187.1 hypothetical protein [Spirochaetota bacterium]
MKIRLPKAYILIITVLSLLFFITVFFAPVEQDWSDDFTYSQKKPYGCFALYKLLTDNDLNNRLSVISKSVFDHDKEIFANKNKEYNRIFITANANFDQYESETVLAEIYKGATFFIAADYFTSSKIPDRMGFELTQLLFYNRTIEIYHNNDDSAYKFKKGIKGSYISKYNPNTSTVIATTIDTEQKEPVAISIKYGKGELILCSTPRIFTNYHLKENYRLAFLLLGRLSVKTTYWDEYYKPGNVRQENILSFIDSDTMLSFSFYGILVIVIIFALFGAKRRERAIPVILPLKNSSLSFAKSMAALYLTQGSNIQIARKIVQNFYSHFYSQLPYADTNSIKKHDRQNISALCSQLSGMSTESCYKKICFIDSIEKSKNINSKELIFLYKTIIKLLGKEKKSAGK